jgi:hypothetical protein
MSIIGSPNLISLREKFVCKNKIIKYVERLYQMYLKIKKHAKQIVEKEIEAFVCGVSTITRSLYLHPYEFYSNLEYMSEKKRKSFEFSFS